MPSEPYATVTLRKEVLKKLADVNPKKPTAALVTEAINMYVELKSPKPLKRPELNWPVSGTSAI